MADNPTTSAAGLLVSTQLRATDTGSGEAFHEKTAPWINTGLTGAQVVTVSSSVISSGAGLTIPAGATHCFLSVETNTIRFYNTGDTPTASNGHALIAGAGPIELDNLASLKLIRVSADATVQISYHKYV